MFMVRPVRRGGGGGVMGATGPLPPPPFGSENFFFLFSLAWSKERLVLYEDMLDTPTLRTDLVQNPHPPIQKASYRPDVCVHVVWILQSTVQGSFCIYVYIGSISRTTPHEDNSPPDKNEAQPLPTRTTIPRTTPHQDNSPLGPLPWNSLIMQFMQIYSKSM